jgi:hypothetical protein
LNKPRRLALVWVLLPASFGVCDARAQVVTPPAEAGKKITVERCAQLAASDPIFGPLAQVCEYALSPNNLPFFVCDETVEQFIGNGGPKDWQHLAVITAVVTFEHGKEEKISKVAKDGRPIRILSGTNKHSDVAAYFLRNMRLRAPALNMFGSDLLWIFDKRGKAQFEYKGKIKVDDSTMIVFGYRVRKGRGPSFGWLWPEQEGTYVAMNGLLWIDERTSSLKRLVAHYTDFDPVVVVYAASNAIDYGWVEISDLGKFLLPTGAEYKQCDQSEGCWRDLVSFSNCRKYAGKSRILPAE